MVVPRAALALALAASARASKLSSRNVVSDPASYVNTLGGTDSRYDMSHGNILPVVNRPWGFSGWTPVTDTSDDNWLFHPTDARIYGVRCTKQPSPWIGDYGQFRIMADMPDAAHNDNALFSSFASATSTFKPYLFNASLLTYGNGLGEFTRLEVTATTHGAAIRVTFPSFQGGEDNSGWSQTRRVYVSLNSVADSVLSFSGEGGNVTGVSRTSSGSTNANFGHYFVLTLHGGAGGDQPLNVSSSGQGVSNGQPWAWFQFDPSSNDASTRVITVRVATSLISVDQAGVNLAAQLPLTSSFDALVEEAHDAWNDVLSTVDIVDAGPAYTATPQALTDVLTTTYSCLWRGATFPRFIHEVAANGSLIHYSPYDSAGGVYPGPLVSDSGFWDAYRTVYPAGQIFWPSVTSLMMQGWVNAYKEGGWLPKWASPGYRGSMVGTMGDVSLADAIVKRAWLPGFDAVTAYAAIRKDAFSPPPPGEGEGRTCLPQYTAYDSVVPAGTGCSEVVSRTLNYQLSDWAIAQAALSLGGQPAVQDAPLLLARAANYSLQFDGTTGFMRPRTATAGGLGPFSEPFDQFAWGDPYTEAGPWQYRFYVPFDPPGLHALYASSASTDMCDALEAAQTMAGTYHVGAYGSVIHEQTEMATLCWGQYEHDNQPVHHMLWMLIAGDPSGSVSGACASRGQYWLRQVTSTLYKPGADMFVGDEDNGQMAHWYNLAALGLYSLAPGGPNITLGSPLFAHARVRLDNSSGLVLSPFLDILGNGQGAEAVYVAGVSWQGAPVTGAVSLPYSSLMTGGTLAFDLTTVPPSGYTGYNGHVKAREQGRPWPWATVHPKAREATRAAAGEL